MKKSITETILILNKVIGEANLSAKERDWFTYSLGSSEFILHCKYILQHSKAFPSLKHLHQASRNIRQYTAENEDGIYLLYPLKIHGIECSFICYPHGGLHDKNKGVLFAIEPVNANELKELTEALNPLHTSHLAGKDIMKPTDVYAWSLVVDKRKYSVEHFYMGILYFMDKFIK